MDLSDLRTYFSTKEVTTLLKITKYDLYTIMRPIRTKGEELPPLFKPESEQFKGITHSWVFSQKDVVRLSAYFKVFKEYKIVESKLSLAKKELSK